MATSLQERLKLKQYQVDTWTTREQLCLASAVLRSGDQNWVAVRRNIKMLTTENSRPNDWYSTKNCALQYAKLLECVDTPKRKRERGDSSNETPGEIVTKMLTKQRIDELSTLVSEEKAAYNNQKREIQELESGRMDHQLDELWEQLLKEHAEEEEEERRHQQWLKEREEKITSILLALKHQGPKVHIPPNKKKNKPPWPATSAGGARRNSGLSETSSEIDSALDSPDVHDPSAENAGQEGIMPEPDTKPTPTSPLLSSLLNKSPIMPGSSISTLSQGRGARPGFSPVSMALQNLVTSAISGTDSLTKSSTPPGSGSTTLSRLLDLPPSTPGGPLPRLSDLPTHSYEPKEPEKNVNVKESKDKGCSPEGKSTGCGSAGDNVTADVKQETILDEPEKTAKNGKTSRETDAKDTKFRQHEADVDIKKKESEIVDSATVSSAVQPAVNIEKPAKALKERDGKRREEKRKDSHKEKEKKTELDIKEENPPEIVIKNYAKDIVDTIVDVKEDKFIDKNKLEDYEDEKNLKLIKDSKLYKELESQSKKIDKTEKKELEDFEQDNSESKEWMSEEEGNFPRSGKRKISGADYLGYSPLICESAPTSPASTHYGDDPDNERSYKSWKKPIMILWNEIAAHRFASIFLRPITDEQAPGYHSVVYRPMDLQTIKRNIESGIIRNTAEFQRDMMLMFLNATMYNTSDHNVHQMAHQMMQDTISTIEEFLNTQMLARAEETPQKSLRRETRESSAKRGDDDQKRKRDSQDEKSTKKRR